MESDCVMCRDVYGLFTASVVVVEWGFGVEWSLCVRCSKDEMFSESTKESWI